MARNILFHRRGLLRQCGSLSAALLAAPAALGAPPPKVDDGATRLRRRALALHKKHVVFVIHDHNPIEPDVPRMSAGGVAGKLFNLGVDVDIEAGISASATRRTGWSKKILAALDDVDRLLANHQQRVTLVRTAEEIEGAKRAGKIAIMLGVEGGKLLEGNLELLKTFYDRGLRELQLRWAVPNQIVEDENLTYFGRQVVKECNRLGIIISLTHIPTPAFYDVIALTHKPPIVCHGVATVPGSGMSDLTDRKLKALVAHRGVVGIHFYTTYLGPQPTVQRVVQQVDYLANLVGIETIALGVDFFPTTGAWEKFQRDQGATNIQWAIPHIGEIAQVTEALLARNYPEPDIAKILGGNFLRVCREVFGK